MSGMPRHDLCGKSKMRMKKNILYFALAALLFCSCARIAQTGLNDANKRYIDAWVQVNHPGAPQTALGSYILEDVPGSGALAGTAAQNGYVRLEYTYRNFSGSIIDACSEQLAKQLGTYDPSHYYGPVIWSRGSGLLAPGFDDALADMRAGGTRTVLIPGWLLSTVNTYKTEKEYRDKVSGTSGIYELKLYDVIPDIKKWETDSVGRYVAANFPGKTVRDSLKYGFYYVRTGEPSSNIEFPADTTIYMDYVLRLLNGNVIDTNVRDTATFYGIYSSRRTYEPTMIAWHGADGSYKDIKFGTSSSAIDGFLFALSNMHPHEKGTAVFYSGLGYGYRGSGDLIPSYSPLRFELEIVDKP